MNTWCNFHINNIPLDFYLNPRYEIEVQLPNGTWIFSYYTHLISRKDIENVKDPFRYRLSNEIPKHQAILDLWWDMALYDEAPLWVKFTGYIPNEKIYLYML